MSGGICLGLLRGGGMALVRHDDGYAVAELFGDDIERGDHLSGDWEALGSEVVRNITQGGRIEVYLQGSWARAEAALRANGGM
jgi:hypothetical protein